MLHLKEARYARIQTYATSNLSVFNSNIVNYLFPQRIIWSSMKWQVSLVHLKYGSSYDHWNVYTLLGKHVSAMAPGCHVCGP